MSRLRFSIPVAIAIVSQTTLIIYICGDNGTSAEGTLSGTFNQMTAYNGILGDVPEPLELLHFEDWGSDKTYPHMAVGWAWAFDTPFKWTKQDSVALRWYPAGHGLISWPGHIKKTWAAFVPSSTTSSTLLRRSLNSRAFGHLKSSTGSSRSRSKA